MAQACVALPSLEVMLPRSANAADPGIRNFMALFMPNGVDRQTFHPPTGALTASALTAPLQDLPALSRLRGPGDLRQVLSMM